MGKINQGLVGGLSGQVGPVVGAIVRGEAILRMRPKKSTKPAKQSQVEQRTKFGIATKFIRPVKSVVDLGYQSYTSKMSASNAAVQDFLKNAISGVSPNFVIDYEKVTLSKGHLPEQTVAVVAAAQAQLKFTWNPGDLYGPDAVEHANDRMVIVLYDDLKLKYVVLEQVVVRSAAKFDTDIPKIFAGRKMHVWTFFVSPDQLLVSDSQYVGSITILA